MQIKYEDIVDVTKIGTLGNKQDINKIIKIIECAKKEKKALDKSDGKKVLLLCIDMQNDFMEDIGPMGVTGSKKDVENLTRWIYNNRARISQIICSLDSHSPNQIFHASWWQNEEGMVPNPYTIITYEDVKNGKWKPTNGELDRSLEYLENLEKQGNRELCIWPNHCIEGTKGADLETELTKMIYFQSMINDVKPIFVHKGQDPYSEMYGIIKPEYDRNGYVNTELLKKIEEFDEVYIAGEASSHCLLDSVVQILEYFGEGNEFTKRISVLEDCTSPIRGFEEITKTKFKELEEKYGINIIKSTDKTHNEASSKICEGEGR